MIFYDDLQCAGKRKYGVPQQGDTVYLENKIKLDISNIHICNLYISGSLSGTSLLATNVIIDGDCQVSNGGLIDLSLQFNNLILNGYNNIIPYAGFIGGIYSTVTYNGFFDQNLLDIPYNHLTTLNGDKYQTSDITIGGDFNQQSNYECSTYNLTVYGTSMIGQVGQYLFSKKSPIGSILFVGAVDFEGNTNLSGNPNIEFRGGISIHTFSLIIGSGVVTFSTNNQTINCSAYLGGLWNASIIVQGAITITLIGGSPFQVNNTINGTVGGSTFNNEGVLFLGYNSVPMTTGVFNYHHTSTSTLGYVFSGSCTLPYSTFANLSISGTGTKRLGSNTVVSETLSIDGVMDCAGFNLSVGGTFTTNGDFRATLFSNILFVGFAQLNSGVTTGFDLRAGNPNVEFRGGIDVHALSCYTGTGTFAFTTNNQSISFSAYNGGLCEADFLISGAITVSFTSGVSTPAHSGLLNGDNVNSIFNNKGTLLYTNSQQPMQTGKLYCNQTANTFIYGLVGNQDIASPSDSAPGYHNLTLNGSGTKKLLGNISVKGTSLLTSPAILDSNGFVLTNP